MQDTLYPYNHPIILTDQIYANYREYSASGTVYQRQAAYLMAEMQVSLELGTFLLPTNITGTYNYKDDLIQLRWGYVNSIDSVLIYNVKCQCELVENEACALVYEPDYGYIRVIPKWWGNFCGCGSYGVPFQAQVTYNAGLPTGMCSNPMLLSALAEAAYINLNQMVDANANEGGDGNPGVQQWSSISHSESRVKESVGNSIFGTSPLSNHIKNMLSAFVGHKKVLRIH